MAVSPLRVSILRGVGAMANGVKNPFGTPQLGGSSSSRLAPKKKLGSTVDKVAKTPMHKFEPGKTNTGSSTIKGVGQDTSSKQGLTQKTSVGRKSYGQTGRSAPNVGPVGASGSVGYKQRDMRKSAAKAAMNDMRQKRLNNG